MLDFKSYQSLYIKLRPPSSCKNFMYTNKHRRISWGGSRPPQHSGWLLIRAKNGRFSWLKRIFMILIRANTERQIPVIRATLVSAPPPQRVPRNTSMCLRFENVSRAQPLRPITLPLRLRSYFAQKVLITKSRTYGQKKSGIELGAPPKRSDRPLDKPCETISIRWPPIHHISKQTTNELCKTVRG